MTPKEKAKELINKYSLLVPIEFGGMDEELAKKCSLIAVDEIVEECGNWTGGTNDGWDTKRFDYWQEVKQEIELL